MTTVHWRKYGINGKTAVHQAELEPGAVVLTSLCGRQVYAEQMEEPKGWAPWATALHGTPLPPDMKWRVDEPITCKRCIKKGAS
jgi:hypothetical protein